MWGDRKGRRGFIVLQPSDFNYSRGGLKGVLATLSPVVTPAWSAGMAVRGLPVTEQDCQHCQ